MAATRALASLAIFDEANEASAASIPLPDGMGASDTALPAPPKANDIKDMHLTSVAWLATNGLEARKIGLSYIIPQKNRTSSLKDSTMAMALTRPPVAKIMKFESQLERAIKVENP